MLLLPVHRLQMQLGMHAQSNVMMEEEDMKLDQGDELEVETYIGEDDLLALDLLDAHATWFLWLTINFSIYAHKGRFVLNSFVKICTNNFIELWNFEHFHLTINIV